MVDEIPSFLRRLDRPRAYPEYTKALAPSADQLLSIARNIFSIRERRRDFLSDSLLGEPAWDLMLALYIASLEGRPVSVSNLAAVSGVPATTALRWLGKLKEQGFARQRRNQLDGRVKLLTLEAEGHARMTAFLSDAWRSMNDRNANSN